MVLLSTILNKIIDSFCNRQGGAIFLEIKLVKLGINIQSFESFAKPGEPQEFGAFPWCFAQLS